MPMPSSGNGGTWLSNDVISHGAMNIKTNLVIPYGTYTPTVGTDTVAGEVCVDTTNNVLYVVNGANNAYALAFNQSLRTTDSPTFAGLTVNSLSVIGQNYAAIVQLDSSGIPWYKKYTINSATWGSWTSLTGAAVQIASVTIANNVLHVVVRNSADSFWYKSVNLTNDTVITAYTDITASFSPFTNKVNQNLTTSDSPTFNGLQIGTVGTPTSTTTPLNINLGSTYSSAGGAYPKLVLYDDNSGNVLGLGVSAGSLDFMVNAGGAQYNFYSGSSNTMRLDASGNLTISGYMLSSSSLGNCTAGSTTGMRVNFYSANNQYGLGADAGGYIWGKAGAGFKFYLDSGSALTGLAGFYSTGINCYVALYLNSLPAVTSAHSLVIDANGQVGYASSSLKYKKNIHELTDCNWIYKLQPVTFDWRNGSGKNQIGLIAEQVAEVEPRLVYFKNNEPESVYYEKLIVPLLVEIQVLKKELKKVMSVMKLGKAKGGD
jgi:hypothetical protein